MNKKNLSVANWITNVSKLIVLAVALGSFFTAFAQEKYPMYYPTRCETGEWGYVDAQDNWAIPPRYTALLYETNGGMYPVSINGKWGFVGVSGEPLTDIAYDAAVCEINYDKQGYPVHFAALRRKGKWAFIDVQGKFVTDFKYDEVLIMNGKYIIRTKDENGKMKSGSLDKDGHEIWNK